MKLLAHIIWHTVRWFLLLTICILVPIFALWSIARIVEGGFSWGEIVAKVSSMGVAAGLLLLFSAVAGVYFGSIAAWTERR